MRANKAGRPLRVMSADPLCNVPCFKGELVARLRRGMPEEESLERGRRLFAALGDRQRLKILWALDDGEELCVCDVAHVLRVGVSVASHHLRKLRDLGVLRDRDDGKMVYYSLRDSSAARIVARVISGAPRR